MERSTPEYCLAFDLSTMGSQIGLLDESDQQVCHLSKFDSSFGSAVGDRVTQIFKNTGIERCQIGKVLVQTGPGSFTGIKVGLSFAYGFVQGDQQLTASAGYSSLSELTALYPNHAVVLPATRQTAYVSYFSDGHLRSDILYKLKEGWVVFDRDFKSKFSIESALQSKTIFLIENRFSSGIDFECDKINYSFDQYCQDTKKIWSSCLKQKNFSSIVDELPKPNYIRMASPIELEQVSGHLKKDSK